MLSRRGFLTGTLATGIARSMRLNASPAEPHSLTPPRFEIPDQACDCHVHVIGDPSRFPFAASRTYTPEPASVEELQALHRALHMRRVVIVQPSVYGTDNSCTLDAIKRYGPAARAIGVLPAATSSATLDDLARAGMRGVRVNVGTSPDTNVAEARSRLAAAIEQVQGRNWHVQVYAPLAVVAGVSDLVQSSPVPIVFDHFGGAKAASGVQQAGFENLLQLVARGKAYVKVSGVYRASSNAPDYGDAAPLARALVTANSRRILWGSDWPHPDTTPGRKPNEISPLLRLDDGHLLNLLATWVPDPALRKTILVDNPAALYGF